MFDFQTGAFKVYHLSTFYFSRQPYLHFLINAENGRISLENKTKFTEYQQKKSGITLTLCKNQILEKLASIRYNIARFGQVLATILVTSRFGEQKFDRLSVCAFLGPIEKKEWLIRQRML